ncbi:MAG TPA: arsenate reductase (glutaredoxin) [Beijerinckiaceae bacterium]|nr:arsenate reductase (glutaredoxin) [Beijerinckiaceae bacterium]
MRATIYHNPSCGTSRTVLAQLRVAGYQPIVVEYLKTGWTQPQLEALFAAAGITPRQALRTSNSPAEVMGLTAPGISDATILAAMVREPVLVNRPIVVTDKGTRLCRPAGLLEEIL